MKKDFNQLANFWRSEYSSQVNTYTTYKSKNQLQFFANMFAPGDCYFYVLNLHNLELDYVSKGINEVMGISETEATIEKIISTALPEEIDSLNKKENVIKDFYLNFVPKDQVTDYKILYTYKMKNFRNEIHTMLLQVTVISTTEKGIPLHALGIHTKINHLHTKSLPYVSFINLSGGTSYYNVSITDGTFKEKRLEDNSNNLSGLLTKREIEIVIQISKGLNADEIAEVLCISTHTVQTHKKNILNKVQVKNTAQLIAKSYLEGIIV